jgi:phage-related protein
MANGDSTSVNPDLDRLHDMLIAINQQLSSELGTITDTSLASAVVTEMREVVHRIDLVQSQLFTEVAARISSAVNKVNDANGALQQSLQDITDASDFIKSVTSFLTLVDKAIDVAKLV